MGNFERKTQEMRLHALNKTKNATSAIWRGKKKIRSGANIQHQPQEQSSGRARRRERKRGSEVEVGGERSGKVWDVASNLASAAFPRPS